MRAARVTVFVVFCQNAHLDPEIKIIIGTYILVQRDSDKNFIILIFDKNASFRSYGVICLPRMPPITLDHPKYGYPRNQRNVDMTLLFAILTKNASF